MATNPFRSRYATQNKTSGGLTTSSSPFRSRFSVSTTPEELTPAQRSFAQNFMTELKMIPSVARGLPRAVWESVKHPKEFVTDIGKSYVQTGRRAIGDIPYAETAETYRQSPLFAPLEDISNVLSVLPIVGGAAKAVGTGAKAARLGTVARAAGAVEKAAASGQRVLTAPIRKPFELAKRAITTKVITEPVEEVVEQQVKKQITRKVAGKAKKGVGFYSPNIEEEVGWDLANKRLRSANQSRYHALTDEIDESLGLKGKSYNSIGDTREWGTENSIIKEYNNVNTYDELRYSLARKGKEGYQKAVIPFMVDDAGKDALYRLDIADTDLVKLRGELDAAGIDYRTFATIGKKVKKSRIYIFDQGTNLVDNVNSFANKYGAKTTAYTGTGEFLGGETRAQGLAAYTRAIADYESKYPAVKASRIQAGQPTRAGVRDSGLPLPEEIRPAIPPGTTTYERTITQKVPQIRYEQRRVPRQFFQEQQLAGAAAEMIEKRQQQLFAAKKGIETSELTTTLEGLNDFEKEIVIPVAKGMAELTDDASPQLKQAVDLVRRASEKETALQIGEGLITAEQAANRAWQPLIRATGKTVQELQEIGIKKPVYTRAFNEAFVKIGKGEYLPRPFRYPAKPGWTREYTGAAGEIIDQPNITIPMDMKQKVTHRISTDLMDDVVKAFQKKPTSANPVVMEGGRRTFVRNGTKYVEFAPKGAIRFYPLETEAGKIVPAVSKKVQKVFLPEAVVKELNTWISPKGTLEKFLNYTIDPAMDAWRVSVLGLMPRWVFNNFVGNTILNLAGGVANPLQYARALWRLTFGSGKGLPAEVTKGGIYASETISPNISRVVNAWKEAPAFWKITTSPLVGTLKAMEVAGTPLTKLNRAIETWFRTTHYLSKVEPFIGEGIGKKAAIKSVDKFLFNYSKLLPFEKRVMRRIFPFYSWIRNINELAVKLPSEAPGFTYTMQRLAQMQKELTDQDKAEGIPEYLAGRIETPWVTEMGGKEVPLYLEPVAANPFADLGLLFGITDPEDLLAFAVKSSNPFVRILFEQATGVDPSTLKPLTVPPTRQRVDEYGSVVSEVPLTTSVARQFPQFRLWLEGIRPLLTGEEVPVSFSTGEPILRKGGEPIGFRSPEATGLGALGIPVKPREIEEITQRVAEKEEKLTAEQKAYLKKLMQYKKKYGIKGGEGMEKESSPFRSRYAQ